MPLPAPKAPAAATTTPAAAAPVAANPAPTAAPAAGDKAKKVLPSFGPGRDNAEKGIVAVPVPVVHGTKLDDLVGVFVAALTSLPAIGTVENLALLVAEAEKLPKGQFPGNKQGRAAWGVSNIIKNLLKLYTGLTKTRATGGEKKPRKKAVEKYQDVLGKLAASMGGKDRLLALLGDEFKAEDLDKMLEKKPAKEAAPAA